MSLLSFRIASPENLRLKWEDLRNRETPRREAHGQRAETLTRPFLYVLLLITTSAKEGCYLHVQIDA